jgi:MFS family permease
MSTSSLSRPLLALITTLAVQALATIAMSAASVLAPVAAPDLGVHASQVGWFVGLAYAAAMVFGLAGGTLTQRHGPIRVSQMALGACAIGLMAAALTGLAHPAGAATAAGLSLLAWVGLPLAALAIGAGYGLPNPSASMLLGRHAPAHRRGLFFSIKQTGVPLGVGLAGLIIPLLLARWSWPLALLALALGCLGLILALQPTLTLNTPAASPSRQSGQAALARVWREPALRRLALASLAYSMTQLCFVTFLVSTLTLEHGMGLVVAAGVLSTSQVLSVLSRVGWGQLADHWITPLRLLGLLGVAMGGCAAGLGLMPAPASAPLALIAALACAATSMAWNGVYFAELAHRVPADELAQITAGTQFLTFLGAMAGPMIFSALVGPLGSHGRTYAALAVIPALVGAWLLVAAARESASNRKAGTAHATRSH